MNMNKQEAIEKIKGLEASEEENNYRGYGLSDYVDGFEEARDLAIDIIKQLDEPEKVVVSKLEAEWLDKLKECYRRRENQLYIITRQGWGNDFYFTYYGTHIELSYEPYKAKEDIESVKRRLVNAILYGYEVEKEKLYTVELPDLNRKDGRHVVLVKDEDDIIIDFYFSSSWKTLGITKLTETEIKKDFDWAWQFAKEVEE